ncbi:MAG TPA: prepilin peptidase [Actinomycetota bacterium]|nr:prepilin peptidase [Actinomycetota bacterium]
MLIAAAAVLGLIFGSFATVVAHRVPRRESIVRGRSRCPVCGHTIGALENLPLVSYALQGGRCRNCRARISPRYPLQEAACAVLFAAAAIRFGLSLEAVVFAAFFWVLLVLTVIDLEHHLLPNRIVYPAFIAGWIALAVAALVSNEPERLISALWGMAVFGGFFFVVGFLFPAGMGGGDVKLAFVLGTFLGYVGGAGLAAVGMFLAFLFGTVIGIGVMLLGKGGRKTKIPFGPFLALGTIVAILVGDRLLDAYLSSF